MSIDVIDATDVQNKDAIRAYWMLITTRGWCPQLTLSAVRAANDIVPSDVPNRAWSLLRVSERIGLAVAEIRTTIEDRNHAQGEPQVEVARPHAACSASAPGG